jgi:hypothetical protein
VVTENPLVGTIREIIADADRAWNEGKGLAAEEPPADFVAERVASHFLQIGWMDEDYDPPEFVSMSDASERGAYTDLTWYDVVEKKTAVYELVSSGPEETQ